MSQLLMEKFMGIFAGPDCIAQRLSIDSERHSALVLQIKPLHLSRNSNANLRTERAADEDQTAWSLALE